MKILKEQLIKEKKEKIKTSELAHLYTNLEERSIDTLRMDLYQLRQDEIIKKRWERRNDYEESSSAIGGEDTIFYIDGTRQRRRAYQ